MCCNSPFEYELSSAHQGWLVSKLLLGLEDVTCDGDLWDSDIFEGRPDHPRAAGPEGVRPRHPRQGKQRGLRQSQVRQERKTNSGEETVHTHRTGWLREH